MLQFTLWGKDTAAARVGEIERRTAGIDRVNGPVLRTRERKIDKDKVTGLKFLTLRLPSGLPLSYTYGYNTANQRTQMMLANGSYWV